MASWLTHLRVAEMIKQKVSEIDFPFFLMGSVAPESGVSDETAFFNNYLVPEKIITRSDGTRSFLWGYYFHLITDKLWQEEYFVPFQKSYEKDFEKPEKDFADYLEEEMLSIDFEYLKENGKELLDLLAGFEGSISSFYEFDSEYIQECKRRIVDFYNGEPVSLKREYKYLSPQIIEDFIAKAAEKCISILVI